MAICVRCGGEMTDGISCLTDSVVIGGKAYAQVRWGQELRPRHLYEPEDRRACGTPLGGVHHPSCGLERCPACHGKAVSCPCSVDAVDAIDAVAADASLSCEFEPARTRRCRAHVFLRIGWR